MDGATNAVLHLDVELGDDVGLEGSVFLKVLLGGSIDDVADGEALNSLVLGAETSAVHADDGFNVPAVVFVAAVVSSLDWHVAIIYYKLIFYFNLKFNSKVCRCSIHIRI